MSTTTSSNSYHREGICVLHVDDDPDLADLTTNYLSREDDRFEVETVQNVSDGLDRLSETGFDCVVSDYDMPGQSGIEFLKAVREDYPELPFILYTGKGSEEVASEAISAGVTDYLQKGGGPSQYTVLGNRIKNVVEQFRTRQAIKNTEGKLSQLAEHTDDILFMFNDDWSELLFINSAYEEIWGGSIDELCEHPNSFLELIHPDDRSAAVGAMEQLSHGESIDIEYRVERPDGEQRWVHGKSKPIFDESGSVSRIVGYVRDITDRKKREQVLTALHKVGLELDDSETIDKVCQRTIDATEEILDFDLSVMAIEEDGQLVVRATSDALPEDASRTMSIDTGIAGKTYRTGESFVIDDVTNYEDGKPVGRYQSILSLPIGKHGNFQAVSKERGAFDETDLELAELLMERTESALDRIQYEEELERKNDRLQEFASIVSHDLRNPLTVAQGRLELVRDECNSEHLDPIARAHQRMNALIEDLLTQAREGKKVSDTTPVDLANLTQNCWQNVATTKATLMTDMGRTINADQTRLQQLLENLMRNAVEHGGEEVTVTIGELDDGFYVEDDGPGIPEEDRDDVFEAGYSTVEEGTGFGLSIVKQVAQAHGWEVRVTDGSEGGARFEITGVVFAT